MEAAGRKTLIWGEKYVFFRKKEGKNKDIWVGFFSKAKVYISKGKRSEALSSNNE